MFGTIWVLVVTAVLTIPIGVGAAVYLEEFAGQDKWYARWIALNIQNLAGVPSIVYGILGLAFIARGPLGLGSVVLTGGIILSLLVLPIVIIASREAIRAVPLSIRQGSLALGATELQTVRRQVLPAAIPGHRDRRHPRPVAGDRRSRAADHDRRLRLRPVQPDRARQQVHGAPDPDLRLDRAAAGRASRGSRPRPSMLLLIVLLAMNAVAIWLRNRFGKKWS